MEALPQRHWGWKIGAGNLQEYNHWIRIRVSYRLSQRRKIRPKRVPNESFFAKCNKIDIFGKNPLVSFGPKIPIIYTKPKQSVESAHFP